MNGFRFLNKLSKNPCIRRTKVAFRGFFVFALTKAISFDDGDGGDFAVRGPCPSVGGADLQSRTDYLVSVSF